ncbi:MAG: hypothetical protein KDA68_06620 [Planctomycetaceae bacterium]|nr:hypothetical protein [Planctomycetaceae bacterium]
MLDTKKYADYFEQVGANSVGHTEKTYTAHAFGVARDLAEWGADEDLCKAGIFHSIYGTELFQGFTLPLEKRGELRDLIGERGEWLSYMNCAMHRPTFDESVFMDEGPFPFVDRFTNERMMLNDRDFNDLVVLQLCDWLEQVGRSKDWDYRRVGYAQMAKRLGGHPQECYDRVFAAESA